MSSSGRWKSKSDVNTAGMVVKRARCENVKRGEFGVSSQVGIGGMGRMGRMGRE
jgi:hypothetical protein